MVDLVVQLITDFPELAIGLAALAFIAVAAISAEMLR